MMADSKRICSVDGCDKRVVGRGLCSRHYQRQRVYGDPLGGGPAKTPDGLPLAFLMEAVQSDTDACILWPYGKQKGYGSVDFEGRRWRAHRLALTLHSGPPPSDDMDAAHAPVICHNRACINPLHLRWATPAENQYDRFLDGTDSSGEKSTTSKLTKEDVLGIRADQRSERAIAADYGIKSAHAGKIRRREKWKHL